MSFAFRRSLSRPSLVQVVWALIAFIAFIVVAAPARADAESVMRQIQLNGFANVVVKMKADSGAADWKPTQSVRQQKVAVAAALSKVRPILTKANVGPVRTFRTLPFLSASVTQEQLIALITDSSVRSVHLVKRERRAPGKEASLATTPMDKAQGANALFSIDVSEAWAAGYEGAGYAVAVVDGGFNTSHPMFLGRTVGEACFSNTFDTTTISQCPSGQAPDYGTGAASNCPIGSTRCDHGTHVASIAVGNDGINFGVARAAKLVPIDVFSRVTSVDDCSPDPAPCELTDTLAVLNALDYINESAETYNIAAVSLSVGGSTRDGFCDDDPRKSVIDMLRQKGVAVSISGGNQGITGQISAPACVSSALAVGATNDGTTVASFSNFAATLDFMASGVSVSGASGSGMGFGYRSGTSVAAPQVAGAWAVMRSAFPNGEFATMEKALKTTGFGVTRPGSGITIPKIRLARAIHLLNGRDRRSINNIISSNTIGQGQSYLRFFNSSEKAGTVTVTIRDGLTGVAVAIWTSPEIPAKASRQFAAHDLETTSTPISNNNLSNGSYTYFNLEVESSFSGFLQHVIWVRESGVFANLSSCEGGFSQNTSLTPNVHASSIGGYISRLRVVNMGPTSEKATFALYDASTGVAIGQWVSPTISSGASFEVTGPQLEEQNQDLRAAVIGGMAHYNIRLENLTGYVQHVMENATIGPVIDMTPKCDLAVAENASIGTSDIVPTN